MDASRKWTMPIRNRKSALNRFCIEFGERISTCLKPLQAYGDGAFLGLYRLAAFAVTAVGTGTTFILRKAGMGSSSPSRIFSIRRLRIPRLKISISSGLMPSTPFHSERFPFTDSSGKCPFVRTGMFIPRYPHPLRRPYPDPAKTHRMNRPPCL